MLPIITEVLIVAAAVGWITGVYSSVMVWRNRSPGADPKAAFSGAVTEEGQKYLKRCRRLAIFSGAAAFGAFWCWGRLHGGGVH